MKYRPIALLAGLVACAFLHPAPAAENDRYREKVVYSFAARESGPNGDLIAENGLLYGTTSGTPSEQGGCCGTAFLVDPRTGKEKLLYAFCSKQNCADGAFPGGGLTYANGKLYGTTSEGGNYGDCPSYNFRTCGTAFFLDPRTGKERVLYAFCGQRDCPDGEVPDSLIDVTGTLYGTTMEGGTDTYCEDLYYTVGCGTVFSLDRRTGAEAVLHTFCTQQNCTDGALPNWSSLISVNGTLYGTTTSGGAYNGGTMFSLNPNTDEETVLYSFCSGGSPCVDGVSPQGGLVYVNGKLYGATQGGGTGSSCTDYGACGVVFSLDPISGAEKVLYSFCSVQDCADGELPAAGLIVVGNRLYGTTTRGGNFPVECGSYGCGTAFSVDLNTGAETLLYSFCALSACADGGNPSGNLLAVNGTLYGATVFGGAHNQGTLFALEKKR